MRRTLFADPHDEFRSAFRSFLAREAVPQIARWEAEGIVDRALFSVGGASGFTSGLVNLRPDLSLRMLQALRAGDNAAALDIWALIKPFEELRARGNNANNVPAVKAALAELGLCGAAVRPPISELSAPELDEVRAILREWETR